MPYLPTAQAWLQQSQLLLSARPTTTRITTKYTIKPPRSLSKKPAKEDSPSPQQPSQPQPPKAFLTLKTYDPASGACLKYKTDRAAEVGRLVAALGTCGRVMAALPEKAESERKELAGLEEGGVAVSESQAEGKAPKTGTKDGKTGQGKAGGTSGSGAGGGKKKKGKK